MILRLLLAIVLGLLAGAVIRSVARSAGASARRDPSAGGPPAYRGEIVKDRVCDTYVPLDRAIVLVERSGERVYFCSEACRRRYVDGRA